MYFLMPSSRCCALRGEVECHIQARSDSLILITEIVYSEKTMISDCIKAKEIKEAVHQDILSLKEILEHQHDNA